MSLSSNQLLFLKMAKEITIAKIQNTDNRVDKVSGTNAAEFLEEVYEKLCKLNEG